MLFCKAIVAGFEKYFDFSTRSMRSEFQYWVLFNVLAYSFFYALSLTPAIFVAASLSSIFAFGTLIPTVSMSVRRLHDLNQSGWWALIILFVPIVGIIAILVLAILPGKLGANKYGDDPLVRNDLSERPKKQTKEFQAFDTMVAGALAAQNLIDDFRAAYTGKDASACKQVLQALGLSDENTDQYLHSIQEEGQIPRVMWSTSTAVSQPQGFHAMLTSSNEEGYADLKSAYSPAYGPTKGTIRDINKATVRKIDGGAILFIIVYHLLISILGYGTSVVGAFGTLVVFIGLPLLAPILTFLLSKPLYPTGAVLCFLPWLLLAFWVDFVTPYQGGGASMVYVAVLMWGTPSALLGLLLTKVAIKVFNINFVSNENK